MKRSGAPVNGWTRHNSGAFFPTKRAKYGSHPPHYGAIVDFTRETNLEEFQQIFIGKL
jgi:hypothetical protein